MHFGVMVKQVFPAAFSLKSLWKEEVVDDEEKQKRPYSVVGIEANLSGALIVTKLGPKELLSPSLQRENLHFLLTTF